MKGINNDYPLIPMLEITDEARLIAVKWGEVYFPGIALSEKHKLASDIMNYARRYHESQMQKRTPTPGPGKIRMCPLCESSSVIIFDSNLDICNDCQTTFPGT